MKKRRNVQYKLNQNQVTWRIVVGYVAICTWSILKIEIVEVYPKKNIMIFFIIYA